MKKIILIWGVVIFSLTFASTYPEKGNADKIFPLLIPTQKKLQKVAKMKVLKFSNGLQAVIEENHSAPVVAVQVWVKTGSGDESDDWAGIAHLIEHMIFKGSEKFGVGELAYQIESKGGEINAFTNNDFTVYHIVISRRFFEQSLELLSDSVFHPRFDPEELEREREVVLEEIRRQGDNPAVQIYYQLMALAYEQYPYRRPVIGYQKTVAGFEQEQLFKFFHCHYRPEKMIVVLVGDLDPNEAGNLLKKYFGKEKPKAEQCPEIDPRAVKEPEPRELKLSLSADKLERAYLSLGWKIPEFGHPDMAGLDLLAVILGQGESSRLTEKVRDEKKLVDQIWAYSNTPIGPGIFLIGATLDPAKLIPAGQEIVKQINRIKDYGVFDWELERAKRQIESEAIFARESMEGRARRLGFFSSVSANPDYEKVYLDQIEKIDAPQIQELAQKYLTISRLAFAGMVPEAGFKPELSQKLKEALIKESTKKSEPAVGEKVQISSAKLWPLSPGEEKKSPVLPPQRYVLKNGIRLLIRENHYVPLVSVRAGFLGGLRFENETNNGVFNFIAEMLTEGTKNLSALEIHRRIEALAGTIAGFAGKSSFGLSMTIPSPNFNPGLELMSELILNSNFPEQEVKRVRSLILASIKREQDQPRIMVRNLFLKTLYTKHPYRLNPLGTEGTITKLRRQDLLDCYQQFRGAENLVIAISGDVDAEKVKEKIEELFKDLPRTPSLPSPPEPEPELTEPRIQETERSALQSQIMLGWLGTTISSPDQPAMEVLTEVLGGMSGRLFLELREKKSLAYEVSASHLEGLETGYVGGYIGCAPEKKQEAIAGMLKEFERLKKEPLTEEELTRAKNSLIGSFEIDLQNNMTVAGHMFIDELMGLGFDHWQKYPERIEKVSKEQIQEIANKYLNPNYALVVINPKIDKKNQ